MIYVALGIVIATFALIIKNFETRMVLAGSGILMAVLGGDVGYAVTQFVKAMTGGVVPTICTVLGFSYVMQYTKCSDHLVVFLTNCLKKLPFIIIPATVVVTWLLSIALPSAAGIAAAVGALLIPTLLKMGVKPAMAASAVYLGTWGNVISPGMALNPMLADIAQVDVMTVIARIVPSSFMGLAAATIVLTLLAYFMKEGVDFSKAKMTDDSGEQLRVNYLYALIPIIPLIILVLGSKQVALIPYIDVPTSMLIGSVLGIAVTRINVAEAIKKFFKGTGDGYCDVRGCRLLRRHEGHRPYRLPRRSHEKFSGACSAHRRHRPVLHGHGLRFRQRSLPGLLRLRRSARSRHGLRHHRTRFRCSDRCRSRPHHESGCRRHHHLRQVRRRVSDGHRQAQRSADARRSCRHHAHASLIRFVIK